MLEINGHLHNTTSGDEYTCCESSDTTKSVTDTVKETNVGHMSTLVVYVGHSMLFNATRGWSVENSSESREHVENTGTDSTSELPMLHELNAARNVNDASYVSVSAFLLCSPSTADTRVLHA